jgi:ubiquitin-hydrolase Zn-finger-containing protein
MSSPNTADDLCEHVRAIEEVKVPRVQECDECVKIGDDWVHLRMCQTCGGTHCCDSSPNRHATRHAQVSGHPVIASAEPGERWLFCYPDNALVGY